MTLAPHDCMSLLTYGKPFSEQEAYEREAPKLLGLLSTAARW